MVQSADNNAVPDSVSFPRFGQSEAWEVGRRFQELVGEENLPLVIAVFLGEKVAFQAGADGSSADDGAWAHRKARTVRRFGTSTLAIAEKYRSLGWDFVTHSRLDPDLYAAVGGGVPVLVEGSLVGVVAVSGLPPHRDHEIAVRLLEQVRDAQANSTGEESNR